MDKSDILNIQSMFECLEYAINYQTGFVLDKPLTIDELTDTKSKYSHILCISFTPDIETGDTIGINLCIGRNSKNAVIYNFRDWDTIYSRHFYENNITKRKKLHKIFTNWWKDTLCVIMSMEYKMKQTDVYREELYVKYMNKNLVYYSTVF
jgi:hypothetical protein